ncbi:alpha/beta hydrolase [Marinococcus halotolerans]|uniref:alpha/beta hydrolase n=1 Tax=Marinococcus halotolerans TaxID=301092 RepID=UPI0003B4C1EE|nr:alpha/beta hydrolase [Marinococcus halotolerans]
MAVHEELQAILEEQESMMQMHELTPVEARGQFNDSIDVITSHVNVDEAGGLRDVMTTGEYGEIPLRIYYPDTEMDRYPTMVYYHGGGFVIGNIGTHDHICRAIAKESDCAVVSVDYRLAPEHPFPAAPEDAYNALLWLVENAEPHHLDAKRIALAGDSAGGNLAAVTAIRALKENGPRVATLLLFYPSVSGEHDFPSVDMFAGGYGLSLRDLEWFMEQYADGEDEENPYLAPLAFDRLGELPPTHIVTAENDVLRDEGEAFAKAIDQEGGRVSLRRAEGMIHGFLHWTRAFPEVDEELLAALEPVKDVLAE